MNTLMNEIRYAVRQLRRAPGYSLTAVLTLALGIGASSAIFCLMDGMWLHPIAAPHPDELARVFASTGQESEGLFNYPDYQTMAQRASAFQGLAAIGGRGSILPRPDGTSSLLLTNVVSSNFFDVLQIRPMLGRVFTARDAERLRTHPGVVLGYSFWQREYHGDPSIVGRQITLLRGRDRRNAVDVWGVLPARFRELEPGSDRDLWMPAETWAAIVDPGELTSRENRWFHLIGRLAHGASVAQANDQVATIANAIAAANPATNKERGARAISDFRYRMSQAGTGGLVLFAIVAGVVLLATVNAAHLLMARALTRRGEVALRISLGARRLTVARQLLIENLLLGALALAAGVGIAAGAAALLPRLLVLAPEMIGPAGGQPGFPVDWRVFGFAGALTLLTMLLLALVPMGQVARPELVRSMQSSSAQRTEGRAPIVRRAAVWVQIAISFALLVSMGALVRSFLNTRTQSIGITRNQVLVAFAQDPDEPMRGQVLENLKALPGVASAAYGIRSPLMPSEGGIAAKVLLPSHPELRDPFEIKYNAVSPDFLNVTGTRILYGRGFTAEDNRSGPAVVVVSQTMARKYWPGQVPIGQVVRLPGFANGAELEARVVGVAEDAPREQVGEIPEPYMYIPFRFSEMGEMTYVIETRQNAMAMAQNARQVFLRANPLLDPMFMTSMPELIRYTTGNYQMMAELVSVLGFIGLALTVVGLYGFLAFRVTQRRREIGIRMALGASREATSWLILRDTGRMALVGLALGLALSFGAARLESSVLFGVQPLDAMSLAAAFTILLAAVAASAWLPARRAASIDPMQALRTE